MLDPHYVNPKLVELYDPACGWSADRDFYLAFESRNPAIDWEGRWDYGIDLEWRGSLVRMTSRFHAMKDDRLSFELRYEFPDEPLVSPSVLRFLPRRDIEERLAASGLQIENLFGTWDAQPFDEDSSHEMIFIARAA